jgi:hypothetical protein
MECVARVQLRDPDGKLISLVVRYRLRAPDTAWIRIEEARQTRPFYWVFPGERSIYLVRGGVLVARSGMIPEVSRRPLEHGAAERPLSKTTMPDETPWVYPYLRDALQISAGQDLPLTLGPSEEVAGTTARIVDVDLPSPAKPREPHSLTRYRYWVDERRMVPLQARVFSGDTVVGEREYSAFQDVRDHWIATRSITRIPAGDAPVVWERRDDSVESTVECPGLVVDCRYRWFPEHRVSLPVLKVVTDDEGHEICRMEIGEYRINEGMPDLVLSVED